MRTGVNRDSVDGLEKFDDSGLSGSDSGLQCVFP